MLQLLAMPFRLAGRLTCLGLGYLMFGFGTVLLIFVLTGDHPDRPGRLVATDAVITQAEDHCRIRGKRSSAWGTCADVESQILRAPDDFSDAKLERWKRVTIAFRTEAGREFTTTSNGSHLRLPQSVAPGDRVSIRYDRKRPSYVVSTADGGWPVLVLWTTIAVAALAGSFLLWTAGGGWRLLERRRLYAR